MSNVSVASGAAAVWTNTQPKTEVTNPVNDVIARVRASIATTEDLVSMLHTRLDESVMYYAQPSKKEEPPPPGTGCGVEQQLYDLANRLAQVNSRLDTILGNLRV